MPKQEAAETLPLAQSKSDYPNRQYAVIASLKVFATKWTPCILCFLADHPLCYKALYRAIPNIRRKMLSNTCTRWSWMDY